MKKSVCICGTNLITRDLIDWDKDADYWYFNESISGSAKERNGVFGWTYGKPVHGVFQMHVPAIWRNENNITDPGHYAWLKQDHGIEVFMQDKYEDVPNSVKYPKDEIVAKYLPHLIRENQGKLSKVPDPFTSSCEFAIALALYRGYEDIWIYGVEATSDTEYQRQRAGIYFWIGIASQHANVHIQRKSLLLNAKTYGYTGEVVIQKQEFELSLHGYAKESAKVQSEVFEARGKAMAWLEAAGKAKDANEAKALYEKYFDELNNLLDKTYYYGNLTGKVEENNRYIGECNQLIDAAGGERALKALVGE